MGDTYMKLFIKLVMVVMVVTGCTNNPQEVEKANVHLYAYEGISVKVVVSKEDYNKIVRLEITQNETGDRNNEEMAEVLETNRQAIEQFVRSVEDSQLVLADSDPENWITNNFFNVRLSETVKTTDNDLYVYLVKYIINFNHETVEKECCGYREVVDYFGLDKAIENGQLLLDKLLENEQFLFYVVFVTENGLYVPQLEE